MPNIKLKDKNGNDVVYEGIETVTFDTDIENTQAIYTHGVALENMEIPLDLSEGDMELNAPNGYLVKNAIIKKPTTLLSENIKNSVEIAGVTGNFIGDYIENVPIPLYLADGDQVIEAPNGYLVKSAIIQKPETLVAENIAKDIEIAGVVGTLESGGGGGLVEKAVNFWDYDGTLLHSYTLAEVRTLTELPPLPTYEDTRFYAKNWGVSLNDLKAVVGFADYYVNSLPSDTKYSYCSLFVVDASNTAINLNLYKTSSATSVIDWGDGTTTTITATSKTTYSHTYDVVGKYVIAILTTTSPGVYLGGGSSTDGLFGASNSVLLAVKLSGCKPSNYAFANSSRLKFAIANYNNSYLFQNCYNLELFLGADVCGNYAHNSCYSLKRASLSKTLQYNFQTNFSLKKLILTSVNTIYSCPPFLKALILTATGVTGYSVAIPCASQGTKIYVRDNLVENYKSATGWSNHADYIYPLSEYVDE